MRILVCPDKFAGTLTASEAAAAICTGWLRFAPNSEIVQMPISDGGYGFLDSISSALGLKSEPVLVRGALGQSTPCEYAFDNQTAYIEFAQIIGIQLIHPDSTTVMLASSFGVGQLIKTVIERGFRKIVIGLGGTSTSDGGAGLLAALGARAFDEAGNEIDCLEKGASELLRISRIDLSEVEKLLQEVSIEILSDVDNPLLGGRGAATVFAPQKGASDSQVKLVEESLTHFANLIGKRPDGKNSAVALGAGAAGGAGFALIRIGASRSSGIERVIEILGLKREISKADLVITGEGKFDWQSLDGKAITGVAKAALNLGKATIVLSGQVEIGRREWQSIGVAGAFSAEEFAGLEKALNEPSKVLSDLSERVARTWNR